MHGQQTGHAVSRLVSTLPSRVPQSNLTSLSDETHRASASPSSTLALRDMQAGSHPTLRSTAEQFLLAATSEKALAPALRGLTRRMPEAVDALLSCADSLSPLLEDVPVVQVCGCKVSRSLEVAGLNACGDGQDLP